MADSLTGRGSLERVTVRVSGAAFPSARSKAFVIAFQFCAFPVACDKRVEVWFFASCASRSSIAARVKALSSFMTLSLFKKLEKGYFLLILSQFCHSPSGV